MKIIWKLMLSYITIIIFMIGIGAYSLYNLAIVKDNGVSMYEDKLIHIQQLAEIARLTENTRVLLLTALDREDYSYLENAEENLATVDELITVFSKAEMTKEESEKFAKFLEMWGHYRVQLNENITNLQQGNHQEAREGIYAARQTYTDTREHLLLMLALNEETAAHLMEEDVTAYKRTQTTIITALATLSLLAVAIAFLTGKSLTNPIDKITTKLNKIGTGDLTVSSLNIKRKAEIGELANGVEHMAKNLKTVLKKVAETSEYVASSAEQLSTSAEQSTNATELMASLATQSAEGSEQQLRSIEDVTLSVEQMSTGVKEIGEHSEEMSDAAKTAETEVSKGAKAVESIVIQMNEIEEAVTKTSEIVTDLKNLSTEIGKITDIITAIADQTNLLALNAAIEAARAGEHGRGFAVVADEVRSLAEQSKNSAQQIATIVKAVQGQTDKAVQSMERGTNKVTEGLEITTEVNASFQTIQQAITGVFNKVQEVAASIVQMGASNQLIVTSVTKVKGIAETTAQTSQDSSAASEQLLATTEEIASSANSLSKLADELQTSISQFKV